MLKGCQGLQEGCDNLTNLSGVKLSPPCALPEPCFPPLPQVSSNLQIAQDTRRKQGLTALLEVLLKLQQAHNLQRALK